MTRRRRGWYYFERELDEWSYGLATDLDPFEGPQGSLQVARDVMLDTPGQVRRRKATIGSGLNSVGTAFLGEALNPYSYTFNQTKIQKLMVHSSTACKLMATGAAPISQARSSTGRVGVPIQHLMLPIFPFYEAPPGSGTDGIVLVSPSQYTSATANAVLAAGGNTITIPGTWTGVTIGQLVVGASSGAPYYGVITAVNGTAAVVFPTNTAAVAANVFPQNKQNVVSSVDGGTYYGALGALSWQSRLLYYGITTLNGVSGQILTYNTRLYYCDLPTTSSEFWLAPRNFIEFSDAIGELTGAVVLDNNRILVFTETQTFMLSGTLTDFGSGNELTYTRRQISGLIGCTERKTIHQTPYGPCWADFNGAYLYSGGGFTMLADRRIRKKFGGALSGGSYFHKGNVYGVNFGSGEAYFCDLARGFAWVQSQAETLNLTHSAPYPGTNITMGAKYASGSYVGGQILDAGAAFSPTHTPGVKTDVDGGAVTPSVQTVITPTEGESGHGTLHDVAVHLETDVKTTFSISPSYGQNQDSGSASLTQVLGATGLITITTGTAASPPLLTTSAAHNLASGERILIEGQVAPRVWMNGEWRVNVVTSTTFTLTGATGTAFSIQTISAQIDRLKSLDARHTRAERGVSFALTATAAEEWRLHSLRFSGKNRPLEEI